MKCFNGLIQSNRFLSWRNVQDSLVLLYFFVLLKLPPNSKESLLRVGFFSSRTICVSHGGSSKKLK